VATELAVDLLEVIDPEERDAWDEWMGEYVWPRLGLGAAFRNDGWYARELQIRRGGGLL
jgi:hypothetical protein